MGALCQCNVVQAPKRAQEMSTWWDKKLGVSIPVTSTPPTNPPRGEVYRPSPQSPNTQVSYDAPTDRVVTKKAMSSREVELCPACNSGNYMSNVGARKRCYDCGYPIQQSGTGVGSTGSGGASRPAQQRGQEGGYNPTVIVDRIG